MTLAVVFNSYITNRLYLIPNGIVDNLDCLEVSLELNQVLKHLG